MLLTLAFVLLLNGAAADAPPPPAPEPLTSVTPDYPRKAYDNAVAGDVTLAIEINDRGAVDAAETITETPDGYDFAYAATRAAKRWTFPPETKPGRYLLQFHFGRQ